MALKAYVDAHPVSWASLRVSYAYTDAQNADTGAELARRPRNSWRIDAHLTRSSGSGLS